METFVLVNAQFNAMDIRSAQRITVTLNVVSKSVQDMVDLLVTRQERKMQFIIAAHLNRLLNQDNAFMAILKLCRTLDSVFIIENLSKDRWLFHLTHFVV